MTGWFRVPNVTELLSLTGLVSFSTGARCDLLYAGDGGKQAVAKTVNGSFAQALTTSEMVPNQWHHLAAIFVSASERRIYLDGGSVGVNTDTISVDALNFYYFGNINSSTTVDVAEVALFDVALDAEQIAALAKGFSVLSLTSGSDLIAYQDCIRNPNRPGMGPPLSMAGAKTLVEHPRVLSPRGFCLSTKPNTIRGPMRIEQAQFQPLAASAGQTSIAGVRSHNTILPGEVVG